MTGPAALENMDPALFSRAGLKVLAVDYGDYPEYTQLNPPFEHAVTVLDLLVNMGPEARRYMKSFPETLCTTPFLRDAFP